MLRAMDMANLKGINVVAGRKREKSKQNKQILNLNSKQKVVSNANTRTDRAEQVLFLTTDFVIAMLTISNIGWWS